MNKLDYETLMIIQHFVECKYDIRVSKKDVKKYKQFKNLNITEEIAADGRPMRVSLTGPFSDEVLIQYYKTLYEEKNLQYEELYGKLKELTENY